MDEATADEGDPETQAAFRRPNGIARIIAVAAACTMGAVVALAWPRDVQTPSTDLQSDGSARAASDEPIGPPGENTDAARPMGEAVERDVADRAPPAKKPDEADERDPADRAPPMEQPELVVRRERAEQRAPRPQATDKQKRHSDARAAVQKAMQDRGVIVGDDAELDRLRTQSASAAKAQRLEEAIELLAQARRRATDVVVDQGFVNRKLVRFNARFDASTDAAARARVESVSTDVLNAMREGRSVDANRALNAGLAALARRGP